MLQAQAVRTGSSSGPPIGPDGKPSLPPAVLQSLMMAAKNGNLDMNNPALQQFKHLMMLQQQQKANQASQVSGAPNTGGQAIPTANANPSANQPVNPTRNTPTIPIQGVPNMDQMIQQAVKQQQIVQQQPGYGQGHNGSGMGNNQQQPPAPVQVQQAAQQQQIAQQQQQLLLQQQQQQQQMLQQQQIQQQQQQLQQQQQQLQQQQQSQPPQPPQRTPSQQPHALQQQQQQQAPPQQSNQQEQPARPDAPPKIWTGDLVWHMPNGGVCE
jgi:hypothetical protein